MALKREEAIGRSGDRAIGRWGEKSRKARSGGAAKNPVVIEFESKISEANIPGKQIHRYQPGRGDMILANAGSIL